jgi:hypothetical protein
MFAEDFITTFGAEDYNEQETSTKKAASRASSLQKKTGRNSHTSPSVTTGSLRGRCSKGTSPSVLALKGTATQK